MKDQLLQYSAYNVWANERIAAMLLKADRQLLDQEVKSSFPSIRKTIYHIWDAETIWLKRLKNEATDTWPSKEMNEPAAIDDFVATSRDFLVFLQKKDSTYFNDSTTYKNMSGASFATPNSGILMHVFNHGTFHRGQIITMLREMAYPHKIESTDLITFLRS